ncbi:DUF397 domain-containing protein [Thermomonospora umbrina]|uniref:Uncharacterized protein DUF397 n=1 Tax=Thermomonospora umbrina TaxID=111806 RepID=A0A3D9SU25_9ACTN|nr:DUF397 domain-containing protein [Thermomonospora umbrina]REE99107.1 uncharacterized protein DUF397 [Thermomonospora umbrina]
MRHSPAPAHNFPGGKAKVKPLDFRKSSRCEELNQDGCVELAGTPDGVAVRDSTDPDGPVLLVGGVAWRRLMAELHRPPGR